MRWRRYTSTANCGCKSHKSTANLWLKTTNQQRVRGCKDHKSTANLWLKTTNQQRICGYKTHKPTANVWLKTTNQQRICGYKSHKSTTNLWLSKPQINSEFVARDLLLIWPGESHKLPGSYKPTVNSRLQINSKSRDLRLICGPGETRKLPGSYKSTVNSGATNQQQIPGFAVDLWARNLLSISALTLGQTMARIPVPATAHWLDHPAH